MYAGDYRRIARDRLAGNWAVSVGAGLIAALLGGVLISGSASLQMSVKMQTLEHLPHVLAWGLSRLMMFSGALGLVQFVIGGTVRLGYCSFLLKQQDRRPLAAGDLFSQFSRFGDGFVLSLLTGLYTMLWTMLFVIPGIVAAYRYAMAPLILTENPDLSPSEAISRSKAMMQGRKWKLFCLDFSFIGWNILNAMTFGIGSLWLVPYHNAAHAAFYRENRNPS